jgi:polyphosphate glucokinase
VEILGIDVGGSGIKGAPINTETGELLAPRQRIATPELAKPEPVAEVVGQIAQAFQWRGPIGVGFPAVVQHGKVFSAANISKRWIGVDAAELFRQATGCPVWVANDADVAGVAEMKFGAGRGRKGLVLIITIGTGLGTALFTDGYLAPNMELGHIEMEGVDAELIASDAARKREELSWKKWGKRFNRYLNKLEALLSPDFVILGGGISKEYDKFREFLSIRAEIMPAQLLNEAGLVGAAVAAYEHLSEMKAGHPDKPEEQPSGGEYLRGKGGPDQDEQTSKEGKEVEEDMEKDPARPETEPDTFEVIDPHKEMTPG